MTLKEIEKLVSKYQNSVYHDDLKRIDSAEAKEISAIARELGLEGKYDFDDTGYHLDVSSLVESLKESKEDKYKNVKLSSAFDEKEYTFDEAVDVYCGELLDTAIEPLLDDDELDALYDKIEACKNQEEKWNMMRPYAVELVIRDIEDYQKDYSTFKLIENESLTEAEEDELSDDELDALDAEEEKAFKQKQADRRARVAGKRKEKSDKESKLAEIKKELGSDYDFDKLFDTLVPDSGVADTIAGEVIRALNRVDYRDFNDGEVFFEGDGLETCGPSMAFVAEFFIDKFNDSEDTDTAAQTIYDKIIDIAESQLTDSEYTSAISELEKQVVAWIKEHEDILVEPNKEDSLKKFRGEEYWEDYIPSYDIEDISLPKNVEELLDLGEIDESDIIWAVQDIIQGMGNSTDDVTYDGWGITVRGLSKADYEACGGDQGAELYDWIEEWAQNEYDDPDEIRARKEEEERQQNADDEEESEETDEGLKEGTEENKNKDITDKLQALWDDGNVYFDTADDDGELFLIVDGWEDVHKIQKILKPEFEPSDEYDTSVLDEFFSDEWGFRDEYAKCDECGKLIRTAPDSYSWTPDFFVDDNSVEVICGDCVRENPSDYIGWLLEKPEERANTILSKDDLEEIGFEKVDGDYENGWYDKHDSPSEILSKAYDEHPDALFIFNISGQGQFATQFELWMKE